MSVWASPGSIPSSGLAQRGAKVSRECTRSSKVFPNETEAFRIESYIERFIMESLILAQDERWRRA
jgi:hypothetical protein